MTYVVKIGGSTLSDGVHEGIIRDIRTLSRKKKIVIVHGGGNEVTRIAEKMGKEQVFVVSPGGIRSRYTDKDTADIFTMVMAGKINKDIVATLQRNSINAVGLSGIDGGIIRAKRKKKLVIIDERKRRMIIDGGYTGKIQKIDPVIIQSLLDSGCIPVLAPVAAGEDFEFLNVDGDRAAAYVAGSLKATSAIFVTDVEGIKINEKVIDRLTLNEARTLLPKMGYGMEKKLLAAIEALEMGVGECIISSGLIEKPLEAALEHSTGTVITNE
ncbi:MAG: [LysW]-aminoadipate/[LysW]-glutamate kinase [Thaumarchaeota archaeon]|nr:[LysW]-aminoadipate/[LysW]-glutamate kinase [Nitrososphaerota archaeon]